MGTERGERCSNREREVCECRIGIEAVRSVPLEDRIVT